LFFYRLIQDLEFFQIRNTPIAHYVFSRVKQMQETLEFTNEMVTYIYQKQLSIDYFKEIFKQDLI